MFLPITNNVFARSLRRRCLALIAQIFTDICENLFALLTTYIYLRVLPLANEVDSDPNEGWWLFCTVTSAPPITNDLQDNATRFKLVDLQFVCCHFKHMKLLTSLGYSSFFHSFTKGKTSNTFCGILSAGVRQPLVNWWAISNSEKFVWQIIVTIYFCIYLFTELLNAALK